MLRHRRLPQKLDELRRIFAPAMRAALCRCALPSNGADRRILPGSLCPGFAALWSLPGDPNATLSPERHFLESAANPR